MHVLVTGGTGFIGRALCRALSQKRHELLVLTRNPVGQPLQHGVRWLSWDDDWQSALGGVTAIVNLAGESVVAKRWTPSQKRRIRESRVSMTQRLVEALGRRSEQPTVLISASAIGYYGPRGDETLAEDASRGVGFLSDTCAEWEAAAQAAEALGMRVVRLRIGLVLGPDGGALARMLPPFRAFLGGPLGHGRQWLSWVHRDDVVGLIEWALERAGVRGALNATAPEPVTMRDFCQQLGRVLGRPSWAAVPGPVLRLLLGEMADMLLTGQRVVPAAAQRLGYTFHYPVLSHALTGCVVSNS